MLPQMKHDTLCNSATILQSIIKVSYFTMGGTVSLKLLAKKLCDSQKPGLYINGYVHNQKVWKEVHRLTQNMGSSISNQTNAHSKGKKQN